MKPITSEDLGKKRCIKAIPAGAEPPTPEPEIMSMAKENFPYENFDPLVREIIWLLNELPYCTTLSSCQGHSGQGAIHCYVSEEITDENAFLKLMTEVIREYEADDLPDSDVDLPDLYIVKHYGWSDDEKTSLEGHFNISLLSPDHESKAMNIGRKRLETILRGKI